MCNRKKITIKDRVYQKIKLSGVEWCSPRPNLILPLFGTKGELLARFFMERYLMMVHRAVVMSSRCLDTCNEMLEVCFHNTEHQIDALIMVLDPPLQRGYALLDFLESSFLSWFLFHKVAHWNLEPQKMVLHHRIPCRQIDHSNNITSIILIEWFKIN